MAILPFANAPGSSGGSGTVTSVSVSTANGVSGSVSNPTTTPAITLTLGAITPSTVNGITITGSGTLALGTKNLTISNTLTLAGTDSTTMTFPTTSATIARTDAANTFTGHQTIEGVTSTGATGTGNLVFASSPTLTTAVLGSSTGTTQTPADNSTKIATTAYVDNAVLGQRQKEAVKYASTAALPSIVYANGSSGVGATLTGVALAAISLDSSSPSVNDRVLIKNQASDFQNGIYTVTATGSGIAVFVLTRATDFDQASDIQTGDSVFVTAGSTLANTTWTYNGIDSPTMGTTSLTFVQAAGPGSYTAGNGISITGTSIAIDTSITVDKTTAQTLTNKTLTGPIMTAPVLGTPASGTATNLTGTASGLTAGNVTTNANLTGPITSSGNATAIASQTGTGTKFVVDTSPTLVTPALGVATATSINGLTISTSTGTLTLVNGSSLITAGANSVTLTSTGTTNVTLPTTGTLATLAGAEALTNKTVSDTAMTNTFESLTATQRDITLTASTDFQVDNLVEVGASYSLEIPATSSLEVAAYGGGVVNTASMFSNTIGVSRLAFIESTDLFNNTAITAATWTDFNANQNFTVDNPNSVILVSILGMAQVFSTANATYGNSRIIIDSAGASIIRYVGGGVNLTATQPVNPFGGSGMIIITGLNAGTHTIKTQIWAQNGSSFVYCRCSTVPNTEFFATYVVELKK